MSTSDDAAWMRRALALAKHGSERGEVPVGALLVRDGALLAEGWNRPIGDIDPSAHAEMVVMREAARLTGNYRLEGSTLYVTMEPCPMCAGALVHARVGRLVFAAPDERWGACGSVFDLLAPGRLNHDVTVCGGVLAAESAALLQSFFKARR